MLLNIFLKCNLFPVEHCVGIKMNPVAENYKFGIVADGFVEHYMTMPEYEIVDMLFVVAFCKFFKIFIAFSEIFRIFIV